MPPPLRHDGTIIARRWQKLDILSVNIRVVLKLKLVLRGSRASAF